MVAQLLPLLASRELVSPVVIPKGDVVILARHNDCHLGLYGASARIWIYPNGWGTTVYYSTVHVVFQMFR